MKQFHNRFVNGRKLVWDVERLIRLSKDLPVKSLPIDGIFEFDQIYWFDEEHPPTCRAVVSHMERIQQVDLSYPIILSEDGYVMDGMHRIARAQLMGLTEIQAVQFAQDPEPDHIL
jgi:myosin-crossreactive antigen